MDYFTKYVEARALKDKSADSVARFIFEDVVCRYSCTVDVQINDQGREFVNALSDRLHVLIGVQQRVTSAYHPQANGLTERNNRTIGERLVKCLLQDDNIRRWPEVIHPILFSIRTQKQKSTQYTPIFLMYGFEPVLPGFLQLECAENPNEDLDSDSEEVLQQRVNSMVKHRDDVFHKASDNIKAAQKQQKKNYDERHITNLEIHVGDIVGLKNQHRCGRKGSKDEPRFKGPFKVMSNRGKTSFKLQNMATGAELRTYQSASNLRKWNLRSDDEDHAEEPAAKRMRGNTDDSGEDVAAGYLFRPVSGVWQREKSELLGIQVTKQHRPRGVSVPLTQPINKEKMTGDGACFFRGVSYAVCGTQAEHAAVRDSVVAYMYTDRVSQLLEEYHQQSVESYVTNTRVNEYSSYATESEILATAGYLGTDIYVFAHGQWQCYSATIFGIGEPSDRSIYLSCANEHFNYVKGL